MSYQAHESSCRYSGVDCERGCNCYNEVRTRCSQYEPRWKTCPTCGERYDVDMGCLACEARFDFADGEERVNVLIEKLRAKAEAEKQTVDKILVTIIHEGLHNQIGVVARVTINPELYRDASIEARFRGASRVFADTEKGKSYIESTHGDFNWGDALTEIPEEIMGRWGILEIETLEQDKVIVNHDQLLIRRD